MGITHFPNGVSSFGVPQLGGDGGIPQTTGTYFFVDDGGSNANDGKDPDHPFANLDYAIGQCTEDHGDIIILMPGHAETVSTTGIAADKAGIQIIGLGYGEAMPTITGHASQADDVVAVTADSVVIKNVMLVGGAAGTTALIDASADADYLKVEGCILKGATAPVDFITLATGADDVSILNCQFVGTGAGSQNFILCEGYVARLLVQGCFFDSTGSAGIDEAMIQFAVCGSGPVWIDHCTFITNTDGDALLLAISENDPCTLVTNCYAAVSDLTDIMAAISYAGMAFADCRWAEYGENAPKGSGNVPATSSS